VSPRTSNGAPAMTTTSLEHGRQLRAASPNGSSERDILNAALVRGPGAPSQYIYTEPAGPRVLRSHLTFPHDANVKRRPRGLELAGWRSCANARGEMQPSEAPGLLHRYINRYLR